MNQPMLLELEAPLKICGTYARNSPDAARVAPPLPSPDELPCFTADINKPKATSTGNTTISCGYSNTAASRPTQTTFSSATTSTAANSRSRPSAFC